MFDLMFTVGLCLTLFVVIVVVVFFWIGMSIAFWNAR